MLHGPRGTDAGGDPYARSAPVSPKPSRFRMRVDPRDVPAEIAARRLGLQLGAFLEVADRLHARGLPRPDPDTGLYDLKAVEDWMDRRSGLTSNLGARDATTVARARLEALTDGGRTTR
jgi:hypothetical protein